MTFEYAIANNYISDYAFYLPIHEDDNYNLLIKEIKYDYEKLLHVVISISFKILFTLNSKLLFIS